jgi:hypothetical protein
MCETPTAIPAIRSGDRVRFPWLFSLLIEGKNTAKRTHEARKAAPHEDEDLTGNLTDDHTDDDPGVAGNFMAARLWGSRCGCDLRPTRVPGLRRS